MRWSIPQRQTRQSKVVEAAEPAVSIPASTPTPAAPKVKKPRAAKKVKTHEKA